MWEIISVLSEPDSINILNNSPAGIQEPKNLSRKLFDWLPFISVTGYLPVLSWILTEPVFIPPLNISYWFEPALKLSINPISESTETLLEFKLVVGIQ